MTSEMMEPMSRNEKAIQSEIEFMMCVKRMYEFIHNHVDMNNLYNRLDENYGVVTTDHVTPFAELDLGSVAREYYSIREIFGVPNKQMYAMFIQNNSHTQHGKRRDAATDGTYVYPFYDKSHILIKGMVDSAVRAETTRLLTLRQSNINSQYGRLFRETDDILTAAGIILEECKNMGDQSFCHLYVQLQDTAGRDYIPLIVEKTRLLVDGEYKGVRLYRDHVAEHHGRDRPFRWIPTYKNMLKIMNTYEAQSMREHGECDMTADDWMGVFRWKLEDRGDDQIEVPRRGEYPINKDKRERTTFSSYNGPTKKVRR